MPLKDRRHQNQYEGVYLPQAKPDSEIKNQKFIKDGQLIIIKNDVRYNAQGQKVK